MPLAKSGHRAALDGHEVRKKSPHKEATDIT